MKSLLWAYRAHINIRNVCLESKDVTTFPTSINPNMQMNALFNLAQATEVHLIFHSCEHLWKKRKEKEMAKTNKNTHNAPVWTLQWLCIITLRSTLPAHLLLPVNAAYRHTHNQRHITHNAHITLPSLFSLTHLHTHTHIHTNTQTSASAKSIAALRPTTASTGEKSSAHFWPGLPRC